MNTLAAPFLALVVTLLPAAAAARVTHLSPDPNPRTRGCQSTATAFHANGDVVVVDEHGQWRDDARGERSQNAGYGWSGCGTDRVARIDRAGRVVWEHRPGATREGLGLANRDDVAALRALPDGRTLITASGPTDGSPDGHQRTSIVMLDAEGRTLWSVHSDGAVNFVYGQPFIGSGGELFVGYTVTNWGYRGGRFQLPGGKLWRLRKGQHLALIVRLDPRDGRVLWERTGAFPISARAGELLTLRSRFERGRSWKARHQIRRMSYAGELLSKAFTPWLPQETLVTATRHGDAVAMTTELETVDRATGKVSSRAGRLRVFDLEGRAVTVRDLAEGAFVLPSERGGPLRVVVPSGCPPWKPGRGECRAEALDVLTVDPAEGAGVRSRVEVPGVRFTDDALVGLSTPEGVWLSALTWARRGAGPGPGVARVFLADRGAP